MNCYLCTRNFKSEAMKDQIKKVLETSNINKDVPDFKAGDNVTVAYKIKEGAKERIQQFKGDVIQKKGQGTTASFTVRKMSGNIGVERVFPLFSPHIDSITVNRKGKVRRAKLFYLRDRKGKAARIKEAK